MSIFFQAGVISCCHWSFAGPCVFSLALSLVLIRLQLRWFLGSATGDSVLALTLSRWRVKIALPLSGFMLFGNNCYALYGLNIIFNSQIAKIFSFLQTIAQPRF